MLALIDCGCVSGGYFNVFAFVSQFPVLIFKHHLFTSVTYEDSSVVFVSYLIRFFCYAEPFL
jgi:hypothetical protein